MTEAEIAEEAGKALTTWRRDDAPALRAALRRINPTEGRVLLYDAAQVHAYLAGKPLPPLPPLDAEHADDLLTAQEAAPLLDVKPSTVRAMDTTGQLPGGVDIHGRRWPRHVITDHVARRSADPRAVEVAEQLAEAAAGTRHPVTREEVRQRYAVSPSTASRILAAARDRQAKR